MIEALVGAGILLVGFLAGVLVHAWAWGGRFVRRPQVQKRDEETERLREALAEARKDAEFHRRWVMGEEIHAGPEGYTGVPAVGKVPFSPKDLRGKGNSFQT